jgi:two-component SAPR family response regulator
MSSILDNIDVDVLLLDINPGRIPAEVLNAFLIKMKSKKEDLSVIIVTKPSEFADNLTEADFVVSRYVNPEQLKRLVELC